MNKWSAIEWALIIMSVSVLLAILQPAIIRIATNQPLSDNAASVLNTYTQSIGVGILSIAAMILGKKWSEKKEE
jgi:hypothetical protein